MASAVARVTLLLLVVTVAVQSALADTQPRPLGRALQGAKGKHKRTPDAPAAAAGAAHPVPAGPPPELPSHPGHCPAAYSGPQCSDPVDIPCFGRAFQDRDGVTMNQVAAKNRLYNKRAAPTHPAVTEEVLEALPPLPFRGERDAPYDNCALVGNSPMIVGKRWGPEIDANDLVARCNNAPVKRFQHDVGSWTSFRYQNERYSGFRESHEDSVIGRFCSPVEVKGMVFCPPGNDTAMESTELAYMLKKKMHPLNPYFDSWIERPFRARQTMPSTGMRALGVLLHVCKHVNLYGFGGTGNNFRVWYWEKYRGFKGKPPADVLQKKYPKMLKRQWKHPTWTYAGGGGEHTRRTAGAHTLHAPGRRLLKAGVVQSSEHNHGVEEACFDILEEAGLVTRKKP
eukprot:jgi/Tetstr1/446510/TSEL_034038.t1